MRLILFTVIAFCYTTRAQDACTDGDGVEVLGSTYDCSHLLIKKESIVGIYDNREFWCKQMTTNCCASCKIVNNCVDTPDGVYIAEIHRDCKYLLNSYPEDAVFGIYNNRRSICAMATTQCCQACHTVWNQPLEPESTTAFSTKENKGSTEKPTPVVTNAPATKKVVDSCKQNCLWIADGSVGECSWLRDPSRGVYAQRRHLCSQGFANGCQKTCQDIMSEEPTTTPTTTTTQVIDVCIDYGYIIYSKTTYDCAQLADPSSPIYNLRKSLCFTYRDECCATCSIVDTEKATGNDNENTVMKSGNTRNDEPEAAPRSQNQVSYSFVQRMFVEEREREEQRARDFMQAIFSMFKSFQSRLKK